MAGDVLAFTSEAGVSVLVQKEIASDEAWNAYLAFSMRVHQGTPRARSLVVSGGATPTVAQRGRMAEVLKALGPGAHKLALVTDATFPRGVMVGMQAMEFGAASWVVRAFGSAEMGEALTFLDVPVGQQPDVERAVATLVKQLWG